MTVEIKSPLWKQGSSDGSEVRDLWKRTASAGTQASAPPEWWTDAASVRLGDTPSTNPDAWLGMAMFKQALGGGPAVHVAQFEGNLIVPVQQLIEAITASMGVRPIRFVHSDDGASILLSSQHSMVSFQTYSGGKVGHIRASSVNEESIQKLAKLAKGVLMPDDPQEGFVFGLAKSLHGYQLSKIGIGGQALERGNYDESILQQYDHVVADMNTDQPCGRLSIFSGIPGSGKTYMVRALLKAVPRAAFVLVPSYLVKDLGSPEILPCLANVKDSGFKGPIALLLEDADQALVNRQAGDIAAISSLLNLGDGILGNILDIRLIATTNAAKLEMDPATRRPGRLCSYLEVNNLSIAKAASVLERLTGKKLQPKRPMTIAECYSAARKFGWVPPAIEAKQTLRAEIL